MKNGGKSKLSAEKTLKMQANVKNFFANYF